VEQALMFGFGPRQAVLEVIAAELWLQSRDAFGAAANLEWKDLSQGALRRDMIRGAEQIMEALGKLGGGVTADDLRAQGWMVAVHNDYRQDGELRTFWLVTRGEEAIKGEGPTDAAALGQIRARIAAKQADEIAAMRDAGLGL
jgi:hypothetical protein